MIEELFHWWAEQMLGLVPDRLRNRRDGTANAVVVELRANRDVAEPAQPTVALFVRRNRRETSVGDFSIGSQDGRERLRRSLATRRGSKAIFLRLPQSSVLERQVTLPIAAERDLDRVLVYEMDRLSPFAVGEVFSSCDILQRDRANGRLTVRLRIVPRANVANIIASLAASGAGPAAIEVSGKTGLIPLTREEPRSAVMRRRTGFTLGGLCACLAFALCLVPVFQQMQALHSVERLIDTLRPRVNEAETFRRRLQEAASSVDVIAAQRARSGDTLGALAALTEILPDDTYLNEFTLNQRRVGLQGQSAAAARLIAALASDPSIRNPSFAAPVVRNESQKTDIFSIQAELRP